MLYLVIWLPFTVVKFLTTELLPKLENKPIPEEMSVQMRASYYFMGALLAKFGKVEISFPGGCNIGARPIDIHIKGFEELGAKVEINKNGMFCLPNQKQL